MWFQPALLDNANRLRKISREVIAGVRFRTAPYAESSVDQTCFERQNIEAGLKVNMVLEGMNE